MFDRVTEVPAGPLVGAALTEPPVIPEAMVTENESEAPPVDGKVIVTVPLLAALVTVAPA